MSKQKKPSSDRELWNEDIQFLLNVAPWALGEKGTLQSSVAALERGGAASCADHEQVNDYQLGWCAGDGAAERWRRLWPVWLDLSDDAKGVLWAHYSTLSGIPEHQRAGLDGALGLVASVALWTASGPSLAKLIEAATDKGKEGRKGIIQAHRRRAEESVREAHRAWQAFYDLRHRPWRCKAVRAESVPGAAHRKNTDTSSGEPVSVLEAVDQ